MKSHSQTVTPKRAQHRSLSQTAGTALKSSPALDGDASASVPTSIDRTKRHMLIAEAAYHRAAKRGFAAGGELKDWLEAEAEIKQLLGQ